MNRLYIPVLIIFIFGNYGNSQVYIKIGCEQGLSKFNIRPEKKYYFYTRDSTFSNYFSRFNIGCEISFLKKFSYSIGLNYSQRNVDIKVPYIDGTNVNYDKFKFKDLEVSNTLSYIIMKRFNIGVTYRYSRIYNINVYFNYPQLNGAYKENYLSHSIGYNLGYLITKQINLTVEYTPLSIINPINKSIRADFPYKSYQNITLSGSYRFNISKYFKRSRVSKVHCP